MRINKSSGHEITIESIKSGEGALETKSILLNVCL